MDDHINLKNESEALNCINETLLNLRKMQDQNVFPEKVFSNIKNSFEYSLKAHKQIRSRFVITGSKSSGKTTFINTLLGKFILPCDLSLKWPLIIRNSESGKTALFTSKINKEFEVEFQEDEMLCEGLDKITIVLKELNNSKSLNHLLNFIFEENVILSGNSKRFDLETMSKFAFILHIPMKISKFCSDRYKNRFEIWNLPERNLKVNNLTKLIIDELCNQEEILNDKLSLSHTKRLIFVYVSDFSYLTHESFKDYWEIFERLRVFCFRSILIVNQIDKISFRLIENYLKTFFPNEFKELILNQYLKYKNIENDEKELLLEVNCLSLETYYNELPKAFKANVIKYCKILINKQFKSILENNNSNLFNSCSNDFFQVYSVSSLHSLLENYMENGQLDGNFWKEQFNLFSNNQETRYIFPNFESYQIYLKHIIQEKRFVTENIQEFQHLEIELANCLSESNIISKIVLSYRNVVKNSLISNKNLYDSQSSKSMGYSFNSISLFGVNENESGIIFKKNNSSSNSRKVIANPFPKKIESFIDISINEGNEIDNLNSLFKIFFDDLIDNLNELAYSIKSQINQTFKDKEKKIQDFLSSLIIFSSKKFEIVNNIYEELAKEIIEIKDFANKKFMRNKNDLIENLENDLESLKINSFVINYYIKEIDQIMDFELIRFHHNFSSKSELSILSSLRLSIGAGLISLIFGNFFHTLSTSESIELTGASLSGSLLGSFGVTLGISIGLFSFIGSTLYINSRNKSDLIQKEKDLWKSMTIYKEIILDRVDVFKSNLNANILNKREKLEIFIQFFKKSLNS